VPRSAPDATDLTAVADGAAVAESGSVPDAPSVAEVIVEGAPFHLRAPLDYLIPADTVVHIGSRVEVALRGRRTRGLVVGLSERSALDPSRLRPLRRALGDFAWLDEGALDLLRWLAERTGAPLGDVVRHALPSRVIAVERAAIRDGWWTAEGPPAGGGGPERVTSDGPATVPSDWSAYGSSGAALVAAADDGTGSFLWSPLPGEDVGARLVELITACLAGGRDVLLIVPDPASPTATHVLAAAEAVGVESVDLRGGPGERASYRAWLRCRAGRVRLVVGERGAAFMPLPRLGLAVLLDEASPVHKERRSPRHHVREVVLERARRAGGVGLAIGTVPSAAARAFADAGRLSEVVAGRETVARRRPRVLLETGELEARGRISRAGMRLLRDATDAGGYAVVLAARRGEGRALVCTRCGDLVRCPRCTASVARRSDGGWHCVSCGGGGAQPPTCRRCGPGALAPLAAGAERIGEELARSLSAPVIVLEGYAQEVPPAPAVLVMTRGSVLDRPPEGAPVLGVLLPDLDGSVARPMLDAAEDAVRLAFSVAGWTVSAAGGVSAALGPASAGSEPAPQVVVETRDPEHHALRALVDWDPSAFWKAERQLRGAVRLPPVGRVVRLEVRRGEGRGESGAKGRLRSQLAPGDDLLGPLPAEGGWEAYLVRCQDPAATLAALLPLREDLSRRGVELRVDVEPVDLG
jgi:primosomal protein N' (replication factor Y) (superfamily II helicase)